MKLNPKKQKSVAMLAPSFIAQFDYPKIILQLRALGFDKVVEITFGAKMINRDYHKILKKSKKMMIASVCPGIVETLKSNPQYKNNLIKVDSPMIAMAKIIRKTYSKHKIVFFAPCNFKKTEAENFKIKGKRVIDEVLGFNELEELLSKNKAKLENHKPCFDKFYNDYTKIYPLSGGLSKTAHIKDILKPEEAKVIDGIVKVNKFLKNPDKNIKFLDVTFCEGGCLGGPCISKKYTLDERKNRLKRYMAESKKEKIPQGKKGLLCNASGIKFT
jgi:iron only hydrogenase large subunit-like protein